MSLTRFHSTNLTEADLTGANFENVEFLETDLTRAILLEATNLTADMLNSAKLCRTQLPESLEIDPNRDCAELGITDLSD